MGEGKPLVTFALPAESVGLRLMRWTPKGELLLCEPVLFAKGLPAILVTLTRAQISGRVEVAGDLPSEGVAYGADVLDERQSIVETVALDAASYRVLKNRWMRCKLQVFE